MRVEARGPILDRMPLAYNLAWRATSARPPSARRGAHVSERFAGRAIPVLSNASPTPRLPAVPSRESPSSRVPSALPSSACRFGWRHPLVEGSPADGSLSRTGEDCGGVVVKRSAASTNEVGRLPSRVRSDMPHAPRKRGWQAPLARPARDATPPSYLYSTNEKVKRSYRPAGRAGGPAGTGSGETIPSGVSPPDPPSERPTPYPGSEHSWFTGQSGDPLGGGPSHDCPVGPGMAVASHSGAE